MAPPLSDDIDAADLDKDVRSELLSLARPVAETVARHLVATGRLLTDDPEQALAHAVAARRLASRIAPVREAVGLAAYYAGQWQTAVAELRTYHRMSGRSTHLAVIADCERALGRPERAVDLYRNADRATLSAGDAVELLIVAAGARADLGQRAAAVSMLQVKELTSAEDTPWVARLRYAYADALLAEGRREEAREWFARAALADEDAETGAAERLLELDGVVLDDDDYEAAEDVEELDDGDDADDGDAVVGDSEDAAGDGAAAPDVADTAEHDVDARVEADGAPDRE